MKNLSKYKRNHSVIILSFVILTLYSCEDKDLKLTLKPTNGINILIGDRYLIESEDIDFYDNSSHLFYLKSSLGQELTKLDNSKFWILSDGNVIYEGLFNPIDNPCNGDSTLEFDYSGDAKFVLQLGSMYSSKTYDTTWIRPRADKKFIDELTRQGIFHRGLECNIDSLILTEPKVITLYYNIKNCDTENYYILDPQKTPFDNAYTLNWELTLFQSEPIVYEIPGGKSYVYTFHGEPGLPYSDIIYKRGWNLEWLTLIKTGEIKSFSKKFYLLTEYPIPQEEFWAHIIIPGLGHEFNEPEEVVLKDGRIWLGNLEKLSKTRLQ
jgi:hypothetical protein